MSELNFWFVNVELTYVDGSRENYSVVVEAPMESLAKRRAAMRVRGLSWTPRATKAERVTAASLRSGVLLYGRQRDVIRTKWGEKRLKSGGSER